MSDCLSVSEYWSKVSFVLPAFSDGCDGVNQIICDSLIDDTVVVIILVITDEIPDPRRYCDPLAVGPLSYESPDLFEDLSLRTPIHLIHHLRPDVRRD